MFFLSQLALSFLVKPNAPSIAEHTMTNETHEMQPKPLHERVKALEKELEEVKRSLSSMVNERTHQLERAKKQWEQTFDAINDPVLIIDKQHRIVRANLAVATHVGEDIREIIHQPCYEKLMGYSVPCEGCPLSKTLEQSEGEVGQDIDVLHSDGETLFHLRSFPLLGEGHVVHEYRDITEEKAMQQMLVQTEKLSSIGLLAGRVAHEINNPLAAITAQTQLLLLDVDETSAMNEALKDIETAALRCRKIVQDLLNFSRQKPTDRRARHSLQSLIQQTIELYKLLPPKQGPTLKIDIEQSLPDVRVDPEQIKSVLLNLLSNAKAATPEDGVIELQALLEGEELVLVVRDSGSGISPRDQKRIFMPFFTTKPVGLGTGLGLYIVNELIKEHDGRIQLHSTEGQGSEFRITLPRH